MKCIKYFIKYKTRLTWITVLKWVWTRSKMPVDGFYPKWKMGKLDNGEAWKLGLKGHRVQSCRQEQYWAPRKGFTWAKERRSGGACGMDHMSLVRMKPGRPERCRWGWESWVWRGHGAWWSRAEGFDSTVRGIEMMRPLPESNRSSSRGYGSGWVQMEIYGTGLNPGEIRWAPDLGG